MHFQDKNKTYVPTYNMENTRVFYNFTFYFFDLISILSFHSNIVNNVYT